MEAIALFWVKIREDLANFLRYMLSSFQEGKFRIAEKVL
jgi:hypothetical protein